MSIVYLNCRFLTQRITGVQRFAFEMVKALDQILENTQSDLQCIGLYPSLPIGEQYLGYHFKRIQLQARGRWQGHVWEQLELPYFSRGHLLLNLCNTAPLLKFKQIITLHDAIFLTNLDSQKWWFKLWYRLLAQINTRTADYILTVSNFSKAELVRLLALKPAQVKVLGNAPSLLEYPGDDFIFEQYQLTPGNYFLMLGSNSSRKNTQMVARLFADNPQLAEHKLVICGGRYTNLGAVAEIKAPNIIYTDYISDNQLRSLYQQARAFIFPSFYEGFGIPLVEAMALGLPLIVADIPVSREVCATAALYFDPSSSESLLGQIKQMLTNQELVQNLKQLAELQHSSYQWPKFATMLLELIQASLAKGN